MRWAQPKFRVGGAHGDLRAERGAAAGRRPAGHTQTPGVIAAHLTNTSAMSGAGRKRAKRLRAVKSRAERFSAV